MMKDERDHFLEADERSRAARNGLWLGLAAGLAAFLWASAKPPMRTAQPARRFADRGAERRNPMHFFLAGSYPRRRRIDRSGARPLFERRQSVYDAY